MNLTETILPMPDDYEGKVTATLLRADSTAPSPMFTCSADVYSKTIPVKIKNTNSITNKLFIRSPVYSQTALPLAVQRNPFHTIQPNT